MEPIVEDGKTVGIRIVMGVGLFSADYYVKQKPKRWVLRVGEHRLPPMGQGPLAVPVVPYSEVIDVDAPERNAFAQAERALALGQPDGCPTFTRLRRTKHELGEWATLREADCLALSGDTSPAIQLLANLADTTDHLGIKQLAATRIVELNGDVLVPRFDRGIYFYDRETPDFAGTVGDELAIVKSGHLRCDASKQSVSSMVELKQERPESPFLLDSPLLEILDGAPFEMQPGIRIGSKFLESIFHYRDCRRTTLAGTTCKTLAQRHYDASAHLSKRFRFICNS